MARILIVDDDPQLRTSFVKLLSGEGHEVIWAASGESGLEELRRQGPGNVDLAIMDVRLPGMDGLATLGAMRKEDPKLTAIVMTAYGTTETAIEATKLGAFDYILKPFDVPAMLDLVEKALAAGRLMREKVALAEAPAADDRGPVLVGRSRPMQELFKAIGRVAPTDATVLIRGESGTGKELVARAVYQHSERAQGAFLVINCVAIPETLLESELFGFEKGAFTGAHTRRLGKIEQANGGTIFLDEIGDMPLSIQAKILRLLQERVIERLGGMRPVPVNVRILAATNRDLEKAVAESTFREDLFYRLNVVTLRLPSLRERVDDIPDLARHFLARHARDLGMPNPGISDEALARLTAGDWPGNVRQLSNAIHKALIFCRGLPIGPEDVAQAIAPEASPEDAEAVLTEWVRARLVEAEPGSSLFERLTDRFAAAVIRETLTITGGNRSRAARLLGVSRPTLLSRMDKYGLGG